MGAGSPDDSWSSDLRDEKCANLEEKRLGEDQNGEDDPEFFAYCRHSS